MLTESEKHKIQEEIKLYPYPHAACLDALKIVQHHRGWVSDELVKDIAGMLNMSAEEVDNVATFYSRIYRRQVGRNVILICDSMTCMIMGYESVYKYLSAKLGIQFGETTPDGRYTLLPISCLGDCDHAPAIMINNEHYDNISTDQIENLLAKYK
jgi:NADH-quinone oxidoreductase subunit E